VAHYAGRIRQKKARELKERQTEIALRIEQHQKGEGDFRTTLESLISLASRAAELFDSAVIVRSRNSPVSKGNLRGARCLCSFRAS
jgi:hypothetical protein